MFIATHRPSLLARLIISAAAIGMFAGSAVADDPAAILKWVPADAWGFAVVKSLDQIDKKAETLQKEFGLAIPPIRTSVMAMLPIAPAFDDTRPICVIAMNLQELGEKAVGFLVPATDPAGLVAKLQPGEPKEGLTPCNVAGEIMYARAMERYVLVSPSEVACRKIIASDKRLSDGFAPARAEVLARSDVFVSVSVGAVMTAYRDQIAGFAALAAGSIPGDPRLIERWVASLSQVETLDLGVTLDEKGIWLAWQATAAPNTALATSYTESKTSSDLLVKWLPREDYLFCVGGHRSGGPRTAKADDAFVIGLLRNLVSGSADAAKVGPVIDDCMTIGAGVDRYAFSVSMIPGPERPTLAAAMVLETQDAARTVEGLRKLFRTVLAVSNDPEFDGIKKSIVHRPDAEVIEGRKIDTITVDPKLLAGAGVRIAELKKAEALLGRDLTVRFGPIADKQVAIAIGGGQARFEAIQRAATVGSPDGMNSDPGVRSVLDNVSKPRSFEFFIALDHLVASIRAQARAMGDDDPIPVELPTLNAPAAFCGSVQGHTARWEFFMPRKLMIALKQVADQAARAAPRDFDEEDDDMPPRSRATTTVPAESTPSPTSAPTRE